MTGDRYTSGEAAAAAGLTRKALRVYEQQELLPPAERTANGYRLYSGDDLEVLTFIRRARLLGLTLTDIKTVLGLRREGTRPCATVRGLLDTRISEVDVAIADLLALRRSLVTVREVGEDSENSAGSVCSLIESTIIETPA
jgi:MerR family copper efflux transcriptional regulator